MLVRIEAVIATAGNNEEYLGLRLGHELVGRPLKRMLVTFEEDLTDAEFTELRGLSPGDELEKQVRDTLFLKDAIKIHSIRVTRNFQH